MQVGKYYKSGQVLFRPLSISPYEGVAVMLKVNGVVHSVTSHYRLYPHDVHTFSLITPYVFYSHLSEAVAIAKTVNNLYKSRNVRDPYYLNGIDGNYVELDVRGSGYNLYVNYRTTIDNVYYTTPIEKEYLATLAKAVRVFKRNR